MKTPSEWAKWAFEYSISSAELVEFVRDELKEEIVDQIDKLKVASTATQSHAYETVASIVANCENVKS